MQKQIKIIIWDLDDTLWAGTLAEDKVVDINYNIIERIRKLNSIGVINSICSNNNFKKTSEFLKSKNIFDLFILPSINYNPKGARVNDIVKKLNFRHENSLFIDDNVVNLNEVKYLYEKINVLNAKEVNIIEALDLIIKNTNPNSSRFNQYKQLEKKVKVKEEFVSNEDFLKQSNIVVEIIDINNENKKKYIDRIYEMVDRTNQLNFTKKRDSKKEILKKISYGKFNSKIVKAMDKYGNYGIIGFVQYSKGNLEHFLFSCRILNMGIESYVLNKLSIKKLFNYKLQDLNSEVWIKEGKVVDLNKNREDVAKDTLLIGGCDLNQLYRYLDFKDGAEKYFNYGNLHRDSFDYIIPNNYTEKQIETIIETVPFVERAFFKKIDYSKYNNIVYSPLIDYIESKYSFVNDENFIISGTNFLRKNDQSRFIDYAKKRNWDIERSMIFLKKWKIIEDEEAHFKKQISKILKEMSGAKKVFVINGAENTYSDLDRDLIDIHIRYNKILKEVCQKYRNIEILDVNTIIASKNDFNRSIRHYKVGVYVKLAAILNKKIKG